MMIKTGRNEKVVETEYLEVEIDGKRFRIGDSFGKMNIMKIEDENGEHNIAVFPCVANVVELA